MPSRRSFLGASTGFALAAPPTAGGHDPPVTVAVSGTGGRGAERGGWVDWPRT